MALLDRPAVERWAVPTSTSRWSQRGAQTASWTQNRAEECDSLSAIKEKGPFLGHVQSLHQEIGLIYPIKS